MAESGVTARLIRLGIRDRYAHGASLPYLLRENGLDAGALVRAVQASLEVKLGIKDEELAAVRLEEARSDAKVEAL